MIPNVLTIAGSDSGGGAGIQADLKTFSALRTYGLSVITALTAQNTQRVTAIHAPPADFLRAQLDAVLEDIRIDAVKIGMVGGSEAIIEVAEALRRHGARDVVLDPVMVAKSGDRLLADDAVQALTRHLVPLARVITPNLPEAAVLLGERPASDEDTMADQAGRLMRLGAGSVLLKGGHLEGPVSVDLLHDGHAITRLEAPRAPTRHTHGTGCTLSSAIAALLARGQDLQGAVAEAKRYVTAAIAAAGRLGVGHGRGPVHHFHALWEDTSE
jgi:hydroxymethylpyrimidine/phosphomethylpyrimidine kinase